MKYFAEHASAAMYFTERSESGNDTSYKEACRMSASSVRNVHTDLHSSGDNLMLPALSCTDVLC